MKSNPIIKKLVSLVMLMIFVFSITPKKYLHDLVADHTDFYGYSSNIEKAITAPGLDCEDDDLVVTVPFIEIVSAFSFECKKITDHHFHSIYNHIPAQFSATKDVRGPPALNV